MATITRTKTDSGEPRWVVRYDVRENGERKQKKRSFKTSKAANDFRAKTENAILTGMYSDSHGQTVGSWLALWLDTYTTNVRPNTLNGYRAAVALLTPIIGGEPLDGLSTTAIQRCFNVLAKTEFRPAKCEERGGLQVMIKPAKVYSAKTLRNTYEVLRSALDQARKDGLLFRNPAEDVKLAARKPVEYTIPTPEQLQRLLTVLQGAECYNAILTCALLGCRRGEALGLYWSDVDFNAGTVDLKRALIINNLDGRVEIGELKTANSRRTLPLPSVLRDALLKAKTDAERAAASAGEHVIHAPFVFTRPDGQPFRPDSISQAFKRAARRVGLPNMRLHDLRHTAVTLMLTSGIDPKTVSGFVGHSSSQFTLNQYAHTMKEAMKDAGTILENQILLPAKINKCALNVPFWDFSPSPEKLRTQKKPKH